MSATQLPHSFCGAQPALTDFSLKVWRSTSISGSSGQRLDAAGFSIETKADGLHDACSARVSVVRIGQGRDPLSVQRLKSANRSCSRSLSRSRFCAASPSAKATRGAEEIYEADRRDVSVERPRAAAWATKGDVGALIEIAQRRVADENDARLGLGGDAQDFGEAARAAAKAEHQRRVALCERGELLGDGLAGRRQQPHVGFDLRQQLARIERQRIAVAEPDDPNPIGFRQDRDGAPGEVGGSPVERSGQAGHVVIEMAPERALLRAARGRSRPGAIRSPRRRARAGAFRDSRRTRGGAPGGSRSPWRPRRSRRARSPSSPQARPACRGRRRRACVRRPAADRRIS